MQIEFLTPEKTARFPEFIKKWTDIGLSTEPADRPRAEDAIRQCYICAGLKPPAMIVWCSSPFSQGLTRAIILDRKIDSVGDSVWDSVVDSVWDSVRASLSKTISKKNSKKKC